MTEAQAAQVIMMWFDVIHVITALQIHFMRSDCVVSALIVTTSGACYSFRQKNFLCQGRRLTSFDVIDTLMSLHSRSISGGQTRSDCD